MEKPVSVTVDEFKSELVNLINGVQLHPMLVHYILKDITSEVAQQVVDISKKERSEYEKSLKERSSEDDQLVRNGEDPIC